MLPVADVYPQKMRATRDLLRRRMHFVRHRAELLAHIQNTNSPYNLAPIGKKLPYASNRNGVRERFDDPSVQQSIDLDLQLIAVYDTLVQALEGEIVRTAKDHDPNTLSLLQTIPGVGKILALVLLYAIQDSRRFPRVQDFVSYARLIRPLKESAGQRTGSANGTIGNRYLQWAFSEAVYLFLRETREDQPAIRRLEQKYGKAKALGILTHKLGRTVYDMLRHRQAFALQKFTN
jgi:transposase